MGIRFEATECMIGLALHIMEALKRMRKEFMAQAKSKMLEPMARDDLTEGEFKLLSGALAIEVIGGAWVAMDEYGKGSMLERDNPALADYIRSDMFNPLRLMNEFKIVGRMKGTYTDIFGRRIRSSGNVAGVDLERLAKKGLLPDKFKPKPPSRALRDAANWLVEEGRIQQILDDTVRRFPWDQFFVVTKP